MPVTPTSLTMSSFCFSSPSRVSEKVALRASDALAVHVATVFSISSLLPVIFVVNIGIYGCFKFLELCFDGIYHSVNFLLKVSYLGSYLMF